MQVVLLGASRRAAGCLQRLRQHDDRGQCTGASNTGIGAPDKSAASRINVQLGVNYLQPGRAADRAAEARAGAEGRPR